MKVVHVETGRHLYGGAQQVLWLLAGLRRRECDVRLVCTRGSALAVAASANGIPVIEMRCGGDLDLLFAARLAALLRRERPALVHCHSRRGADLLGGWAARVAGVPAVVSRRVDNPEPRWLARLRYRPYRRIVAISRAIAGVLHEQGVADERIAVIRSAVDAVPALTRPNRSAFQREFHVADGDRVLFCAAQFIPRKGHRFLLRALATLRPRYPHLKLLLFGSGPLEQDLRAQTDELGLTGSVGFAGFRRDLDRYLSCAALLVHPALAEGLGVVTLKAAAAAVPVVACDAGGLSEAVVHNVTGLLVPPGESTALAAAIASLLDDEPRRRQMGDAGRRRMAAEFSIDAMVDAHLALYAEVLA